MTMQACHTTASRRFTPGARASRRRQRGIETLEVAFMLIWFFILFFMFIDTALRIYDYGTLRRAAQVAAREASLYSVSFSGSHGSLGTTFQGQRFFNPAWVSEQALAIADLMVNPGGADVSVAIRYIHEDDDEDEINTATDQCSRCRVSVTLSHDRQYIGLTGLLGVGGTQPAAVATLNTELDL